jgi:SAM-dependent MidA family methyltransferase
MILRVPGPQRQPRRTASPPFPAEARLRSRQLTQRIREALAPSDGFLSFHDFQQMALYAPGLGYYVNGWRKLGAEGDFVTAPEISPLFGATLAQWLAPLWQQMPAEVLEYGAGSGRLALAFLQELESLGILPVRYRILEISPDLRAEQQERLRAALSPAVWERVEWLDRLPSRPMRGIILANEVLDALPVEVFRWESGRVWQVGVCSQHGEPRPDEPRHTAEYTDPATRGTASGTASGVSSGEAGFPHPGFREARLRDVCEDDATVFTWAGRLAAPALADPVHRLHQRYGPWPDGYVSEWRPALKAWVATLADCLEEGLIWLADYGFPGAAYYAPERVMGTLQGYSRQRSVANPLEHPGLVDLTASVDFTAVAEAANAADLQVLSYAAQGEFLLGAGLPDVFSRRISATNDPRVTHSLAQQVRWLTLPGEMGERFQVMLLGRRCGLPSAEFPDRRERL